VVGFVVGFGVGFGGAGGGAGGGVGLPAVGDGATGLGVVSGWGSGSKEKLYKTQYQPDSYM
jgi:hypothetical protein